MTRLDCGTHHYVVRETPEEIDRLMLHAGRPVGFITVHLDQTGTAFRVNPASVHCYLEV